MKPVHILLAAALLCAGRAFAHGGLAEISVYDRRREEILAVVSVDGVNVITGQSADPAQSGYVLSPHARLDIQGWRRSLSQTAAFYFTSLADSYAARTGRARRGGGREREAGAAPARHRSWPARDLARPLRRLRARKSFTHPQPFPGFVPDPQG